MRAWGQAFRIPIAGCGRVQASIGMSCQPIAGYEREMISAGCTINIGSKKLLREVASTFCGAHPGARVNSLFCARKVLMNYTHLALAKDSPEPRPIQPPGMGSVVAISQVGGLHHRYERRAA